MAEQVFDVAVIGAGPGGYVAAIRAADLGGSVALVEAGLSGGTCLNVGCIPTKHLLHASELYCQAAGGGAEAGIHFDNVRIDLAELIAAKDKTIARLRAGLDTIIRQRPIKRFAGFGRLAGPGRVAIFDPADRARKTDEISAKAIILATGGRPVRPKIFPFNERVMTTDEILSLGVRPERLLIVGGGVNGCEQATFFAEIGSLVTVVEALPRILPTMDEDVSREVAKGLRKRKVTIHAGRRVNSMTRRGETIASVLDDGTTIETDAALIVIGRSPNTEDIGLASVGLSADEHGFVRVDDRCRTSAACVFAIGDITGSPPYAHVAHRQGEIAAANALGRDERDDLSVIPAAVFVHPELATVGESESSAAAKGLAVKVARFPLQALGIAQAQGLAVGWFKLLADPASGRVLGGAAVSPRAVEVIHEVALAIKLGLTVAQLAELIHAHPTYSELIREAADHWLGLPIHGLKT